MAKMNRLGIYRCALCGVILEVLEPAEGMLDCCGHHMDLLEEQTADMANEKHVPVIEKIDSGYKVTVGSTLHPMTDEHYIQWIELIAGDKVYRQFLNPSDKPEAIFNIDAENVTARELCNLHGLWKG